MSAGYNAARLVLFSGRPVRSLLAIATAVLVASASLGGWAGCVGAATFEDSAGDGAGAPNGIPSCRVDADCVPASDTCCGCPTFAVTRGDPYVRACENVDCPAAECAGNVTARCNEDARCELACKPLACDPSGPACALGYAVDANGCLSCQCADPAPNGCTADTQCVQTRADCCGCQQGGFDTAVLVADRPGFDAMLMCAAEPACPGIDTCTTDEPTCVQGRCELVSPELPVGACGRADLPACTDGRSCLVNVSDQANMHGVGVCGYLD